MDIYERTRVYRRFTEAKVQEMPDQEAIEYTCLHPKWKPGITAEKDKRYQYVDKLWKCLQSHQTQEGWEPGTATASLWAEVCETHSGTDADPIPYNGNMALEKGKYYSQFGVVYLCTRDTESPVYNALADLVGLYVEVVSND